MLTVGSIDNALICATLESATTIMNTVKQSRASIDELTKAPRLAAVVSSKVKAKELHLPTAWAKLDGTENEIMSNATAM